MHRRLGWFEKNMYAGFWIKNKTMAIRIHHSVNFCIGERNIKVRCHLYRYLFQVSRTLPDQTVFVVHLQLVTTLTEN